jgi:DNA-directed RNA polymerase specialized sigma24 family protein
MSRALALAVLARALDDARGICAGTESSKSQRAKALEEGRAFWLSDDPEWRAARDVWCEEAGFDPDYARDQARRMIESNIGSLRGNRPSAELNARRAQAIAALRREGLSNRAIAARLGINADQVRIWVKRGEAHA